MSKTGTVALVAAGSFVLGMAVDRLVVGTDPDGVEETGQAARSSAGQRPVRGPSGSEADAPRVSSKTNRQPEDGRGATEEAGDRQEFRAALHDLVRRIEQGVEVDARTANAMLDRASSPRERRMVLEHLAHHWARHDPESAAAWATSLEGLEGQRALESVLHGWSETDPAGAAHFVTGLPSSERQLHLVHAMSHRWAERDRDAAMQWATGLDDPVRRERATGGVVSAWSEIDPPAAARFAAENGAGFDRREVLEVAARRWADQDPQAALDWARTLPDGDRLRASTSVLHAVAERDPGQAATMYDELWLSMPEESRSPREYRRMAAEVASAWSHSAPAEAAAWAQQLPDEGEMRRAAVAEVTEQWMRVDAPAAGEWALQLPAGEVRDAAAEQVVGMTVHHDPAAAFQWANSLSDEGHRTGMTREVLEQWNNVDPPAARNAFESTRFDPEQRRELAEVFGGEQPQPEPGSPPE